MQAEGQAESRITRNIHLLDKYRQEDGVHQVTSNIDRQRQNERGRTKYTEESELMR